MKWGILAPGTIARKFADTVIGMNDEQETLAAVASRNQEKAESFAAEFQIPKAYGSYEELVNDPEVEAVYIASPNNLHFAHTMLCLNHGKHVLCEKPFTVNVEEAEILYRTADEKGLFAMEAFWIRFLPLYEKLQEIIASEQYGKLRHARVNYGFVAKGARRERKFRSDLAGGALLDIGIYNLGFLYMMMGCVPESFTSEVELNEYGTDSFSALQMKFPEGRTAQSMQAIGIVMDRQAALYFEEAEIDLPDFQNAREAVVKPTNGDAYTISCPFEVNGFEYEIREVQRCVREGRTKSGRMTPQQSVAVMKIMDEARRQWKES
jgi:predicted dehydrogenase